MGLAAGSRLGHYEVSALLDRGGMGEVYQGRDTRLDRTVAIKVLPEHVAADPVAKERFEREARAVAALNHPNICTLHDIGSHDGVDFLVMELLDGQSLRETLDDGPLPFAEALQHGLTLLGTLETLHRQGLVHRDLKPANVFVTPHGLKLIDFGLARPMGGPDPEATGLDLTRPGAVVGTPRYMAPEVIRGRSADARSDLFAVGALLYEMIAGTPAFDGETAVDIVHAVTHGHPPMLTGSAAVVAADRVVQKALEKSAEDRYENAAAMAADLRQVLAVSDVAETTHGRPVKRLMVLPFRMLRADADTEFLTFSLPDAITTSLSGLPSIVVRSALAGGEFATDKPDLKRLAAEAEVDLVLLGTLLRGGDRLQVNAQLLEAPEGNVVWSRREQVAWQDIFQLQEDLTNRIVDSLAIPLATSEREQMGRDVPASAAAYEHYLRANRLAGTASEWAVARDLYLRSVEQDPNYAPAWARLGRIHRVLGKYGFDAALQEEQYRRSKEAFERAFELNPDLSIAHDLYTGLELDLGQSQSAMLRLLERAKAQPTDAHLFAGLVLACRYCGMLEASLAAHERAQRIDPKVPSPVVFTLFGMGRYQDAYDKAEGINLVLRVVCLVLLGRTDEAVTESEAISQDPANPVPPELGVFFRTLAQGIRDGETDTIAAAEEGMRAAVDLQHDSESWFWWASIAALASAHDRALELLARAAGHGYLNPGQMTRNPWFDSIRTDPRFLEVLRDVEAKHREAMSAFASAGGERVLGL